VCTSLTRQPPRLWTPEPLPTGASSVTAEQASSCPDLRAPQAHPKSRATVDPNLPFVPYI